MQNIQDLFVNQNITICEALEKLDRTGQGILLLVDTNHKLLRTITDGDLRRLILKKYPLDSTIAILPRQAPKIVYDNTTSAAALALMDQYKLNQLPVLNKKDVPQSLILRRDLSPTILLSTPHLGELEQRFVAEAFKTNWIAPLGPNVDAFEKEIAEYIGVAHAAAVSSGTAAIHLALRLLGIKEGDTVFCSSLTFVATANPILYQGATPIFIDSDPTTWNMSAAALERAFNDAAKNHALPKAVVVVNLYGQSANMDALLEICNHYHVPLVEDAAESLGASYKGKASGGFGKFGILSFNGNKIITTSGGGMLVSNDEALIKKARYLSTQAREPALHYEHTEIGYNYRMSNVLAGIGRGQLQVLSERVEARRAIFKRYEKGLRDIEAIEWMPEAPYGRSTRWLSAMKINPHLTTLSTREIINGLSQMGIESRPVWKPMHLQPLYQKFVYYPYQDNESVSDNLFQQGICLPSGSNLTCDDQERVIDSIYKCFGKQKRKKYKKKAQGNTNP